MSNKRKAAFTLIMNAPIAIAIALTAQLLALGKIVLPMLCLNFVLAYIISFAVGMLIPLEKWGSKFAFSFKAKPDTLKFGLLINIVINFGYVFVNCVLLTYFNVVIMGKAPFGAFIGAMIGTFVPIYIVGYIVSFLWNRPANKLAEQLVKE